MNGLLKKLVLPCFLKFLSYSVCPTHSSLLASKWLCCKHMANDTNKMQINCNNWKSCKKMVDLMNLINNARKLLKSQAKPLKNVDLTDLDQLTINGKVTRWSAIDTYIKRLKSLGKLRETPFLQKLPLRLCWKKSNGKDIVWYLTLFHLKTKHVIHSLFIIRIHLKL